jgi:hypothetical protein
MKPPMGSYETIKDSKAEQDSTGPMKLNDLTFYVWGGAFLILMMTVVPVWNMSVLLADFNYVFWAGIHVPRCLIISCVGVIFLYVLFATAVLRRRQSRMPETIMNTISMFVLLMGFILIVFSIPLQQQVDRTTNNLLYHCRESEQTHRTYEFTKVLQNLRKSPACAKLWSVEQCSGYEEANPYTDFIKDMENKFKCSGFCNKMKLKKVKLIIKVIKKIIRRKIIRHRYLHHGRFPHFPGMPGYVPPGNFPKYPLALGETSAEVQGQSDEAAATAEAINMDVYMDAKTENQIYAEAGNHMDAQTWAEVESDLAYNLTKADRSEALAAVVAEAKGGNDAVSSAQTKMALEYPSTLFSDADYEASCDGMSARELLATAGDISFQTFYLGCYWILICTVTGMLRMSGACAGAPVKGAPGTGEPKNLTL